MSTQLSREDLERVDKMVTNAPYHEEWYSWQRIRDELTAVERRRVPAGPQLCELVRDCIARPTISTTRVLLVLYNVFPRLLKSAIGNRGGRDG